MNIPMIGGAVGGTSFLIFVVAVVAFLHHRRRVRRCQRNDKPDGHPYLGPELSNGSTEKVEMAAVAHEVELEAPDAATINALRAELEGCGRP